MTWSGRAEPRDLQLPGIGPDRDVRIVLPSEGCLSLHYVEEDCCRVVDTTYPVRYINNPRNKFVLAFGASMELFNQIVADHMGPITSDKKPTDLHVFNSFDMRYDWSLHAQVLQKASTF